MPNAIENVIKYAELYHAEVVILMGMKVSGTDVSRDIGIINVKNATLSEAILKVLNSSDLLQLNPYEKVEFLNGKFYEQRNIAASRKQVLPIIKEILDSKRLCK